MNSINKIPNEIVIKIASYLDIISQNRLIKSCSSFYKIRGYCLKNKNFLCNYSKDEWIIFISIIKGFIVDDYRITKDKETKGDNYLFIMVNKEYVHFFDNHLKIHFKFVNIKELITYLKYCSYTAIVFFTHKIDLPLNLRYIIFKKRIP